MNIDLPYICKTLGSFSGIPIRIFENEKMKFYYDMGRLPKDPLCVYYSEVMAVTEHVGYFITRHFNYYGVVNSGKIKLVIGPTCQVTGHDQELRELAFRADVPPADVDDFIDGMKEIVRLPLESVLQILCILNYTLNHEKLELKDITIHDTEQNDLRELIGREKAEKKFSSVLEENEITESHNSYSQEELMLRFVRKGDSSALKEWFASAPAVRGGTLAGEQLRQLKNTFIVSATLVSRAAIRGGMNEEEAFSLSDAYIRKCELLNAPRQISNLQYHMVLDYTEQVERIRRGKTSSKLALDVSDYVRRHLSETISTEAIARELFLSHPYLASKFKEETGETLTDFILKEKTEEAKRLLRYTSKTATMIGAYLGFSSLSHFSRVFKKYTGRSPAEYRKKYE